MTSGPRLFVVDGGEGLHRTRTWTLRHEFCICVPGFQILAVSRGDVSGFRVAAPNLRRCDVVTDRITVERRITSAGSIPGCRPFRT